MKTLEHLDTVAVTDVLELVEIGTHADGLSPLGEPAILSLRHGDNGLNRHLLIHNESGVLSGYANIDLTEPGIANTELLVHPMHRHQGHGRALVSQASEIARAQQCEQLNIWSHGDHPSAVALADSHGFDRARVLWQLRRRLHDDEAAAPLPTGVTIRGFVPGRDEQRLLEVNNAAFAAHPDQGGWTSRDLVLREREDWFDPAGLLLAERTSDHALLGFHWTKVHGEGDSAVGEVYVLGVHPSAQGMKLGGALTTAGLQYLHGRGLKTVMLYVDEDNTSAVSLYRRAGFRQWTTDVNYQKRL